MRPLPYEKIKSTVKEISSLPFEERRIADDLAPIHDKELDKPINAYNGITESVNTRVGN